MAKNIMTPLPLHKIPPKINVHTEAYLSNIDTARHSILLLLNKIILKLADSELELDYYTIKLLFYCTIIQ